LAARMKDIALDLGVSLMTVSKALRNHADISEETRDRVLKRARQLNAPIAAKFASISSREWGGILPLQNADLKAACGDRNLDPQSCRASPSWRSSASSP
jgi:hypothetical protein